MEQDGDGCTEGPYELRHKDVDGVWATVTTCNSLSIALTAIVFNSNCIQLYWYWPNLVAVFKCYCLKGYENYSLKSIVKICI